MEGAGLKPLQFAKATGVSSGAVTHWLDGATKSLNAETALRIQDVTGYSASWLITGRGEKLAADQPTKTANEFSPSATELALLFDLIPAANRIKRAKAFSAAVSAILEVLDSAKDAADS